MFSSFDFDRAATKAKLMDEIMDLATRAYDHEIVEVHKSLDGITQIMKAILLTDGSEPRAMAILFTELAPKDSPNLALLLATSIIREAQRQLAVERTPKENPVPSAQTSMASPATETGNAQENTEGPTLEEILRDATVNTPYAPRVDGNPDINEWKSTNQSN